MRCARVAAYLAWSLIAWALDRLCERDVDDCFQHAVRYLRAKGWSVSRVLAIKSAGDSPSGFEEIDFLGQDGAPRTALVHPGEGTGQRSTVDVIRWEQPGERLA